MIWQWFLQELDTSNTKLNTLKRMYTHVFVAYFTNTLKRKAHGIV